VAPAMLFSEIEVQKRRRGAERPPILPPPGFGDTPISPSSAKPPDAPPAAGTSAEKPAGAKP